MTEKKHDITSSFLKIIEQQNTQPREALKIIGFPTGMGKTYGASQSSIESLRFRTLSVFIAPRIGILNDFKRDVIKQYKAKYNKEPKVIQVKSDAELKAIQYYKSHEEHFYNIKKNIENEFFSSFANSAYPKIKTPQQIDDLYERNKHKFRKNGSNPKIIEEVIWDAWQAVKNISLTHSIWEKNKNDLNFAEAQKLVLIQLEQTFKSMLHIFEFAYRVANPNETHFNKNSEFIIPNFSSIDKSIVEDYFGLSFALNDIQQKRANNDYVIIITSQKILRYLSRFFIFEGGRLKKKAGSKENGLLFNIYLNTFCKAQLLTPVYYIDEADEFYNTITEFNTKETVLDNFLFRLKSFLDYSNISSLTSFFQKTEKKLGSKATDDLKKLIFELVIQFDIKTIIGLYEKISSNNIPLSTTHKLTSWEKKAFTDEIMDFKNVNIKEFFQSNKRNNPEQCLFLFLCYIDGIGAYDKIYKKYKGEKTTEKELDKVHSLFEDLHTALKNYKSFLTNWVETKYSQTLTPDMFFEYTQRIQEILKNSNYSEIIIENLDFAELSDNSKFMFGNNTLSLIESQIKYLDLLVAEDTPSDNIALKKDNSQKENLNENDIQLSFLYGFLTSVLITSVKSFVFPNEDKQKDNETEKNRTTVLDNEFNNRKYLKAMKKVFNEITNGNNSIFQVPDSELIFDENYIYEQDKNIINIFTCDYEENLKYGKGMNASYIKMNNIHLKSSPEEQILGFFSTQQDKEIKKFSSPSVVYLMSATIGINSYFGNFDFEYINKQMGKNGLALKTTLNNNKDIGITEEHNNKILEYKNNQLHTKIEVFKHGLYEKPYIYPFFSAIEEYIKDNQIKDFNIYKDNEQKYKRFEFEAFVKSIEHLHKKDDKSLFFISQTSKHIKSFLADYAKDDSENLISKFSYRKNSNEEAKVMDNIYIIHKESFNEDLEPYNIKAKQNNFEAPKDLNKDIIIIFYDASFDNNQKNKLSSIKKINNQISYDNEDEENEDDDGTTEDVDLNELQKLNEQLSGLKEHIFNEKKYKILLCSTFGSVSKGFNFVTNIGEKDSNGNLIEKDFDVLNIGMDPYFDPIGPTAEEERDRALAFQRIIAMKDFNYRNNRPCDIDEMNRFFYTNRHRLLRKEHLAHIARTIIQTIGRIERRKLNPDLCRRQTILINEETYNKMREFYQLYDYERYIKDLPDESKSYRDLFLSNLSANNQQLFKHIDKSRINHIGDENQFNQYREEQILKVKLTEEIVTFLLKVIRYKHKTIADFHYIWDILKSVNIYNNLPQYFKDLEQVQNKLYNLVAIHCTDKNKYSNLYNWYQNPQRLSLKEIFFTKFSNDVQVGFSELLVGDEYIEYITDEYHANQTMYDLSLMVFQATKNDFANDVLDYIPFLSKGEEFKETFKRLYTIDNETYYPQKKIAFEFVKTAIAEETTKNVFIKHRIIFTDTINGDDKSYELYDLFVPHKKSNHSAIDVKFWSKSTQALQSKNILERDTNKQYVTDLTSIKNRIYLNMFGVLEDGIQSNEIFHKCLFIKNQTKGHKQFNKYTLNKNFINFIKNEIKKG